MSGWRCLAMLLPLWLCCLSFRLPQDVRGWLRWCAGRLSQCESSRYYVSSAPQTLKKSWNFVVTSRAHVDIQANAEARTFQEQADSVAWTGRSALHMAVLKGAQATAAAVADDPTQVDAENDKGMTPLLEAARFAPDKDTITVLVRADANPAATNTAGQNAMHLAAIGGHTAIVPQLAALGVDVNAEDDHGLQPIHLAARFGHGAVVKELLALKVDVSSRIESRRVESVTPLVAAVCNGQADMVRQLLEAGAEPNATEQDETQGQTPIAAAAMVGLVETIEVLLAAKADPSGAKTCEPGKRPWARAAFGGNVDAVGALMAARVELTVKEKAEAVMIVGMGGDLNQARRLMTALYPNAHVPEKVKDYLSGMEAHQAAQAKATQSEGTHTAQAGQAQFDNDQCAPAWDRAKWNTLNANAQQQLDNALENAAELDVDHSKIVDFVVRVHVQMNTEESDCGGNVFEEPITSPNPFQMMKNAQKSFDEAMHSAVEGSLDKVAKFVVSVEQRFKEAESKEAESNSYGVSADCFVGSADCYAQA